MYPTLLAIHSLVRWMVLAALLTALYRAYGGWRSGRAFSGVDHTLRRWTAIIAQVQLALGLWLYTVSPFSGYFLEHFPESVHLREFRFFGMEHSLMMCVSVVLVTVGSVKAKRKIADRGKFRAMAIWYTVALLIIVASIPWSFSPFTSRPLFRPFF